MQLDRSTAFGSRVDRRLREEGIIWFTTVRADRTPQPSPVWFLWDGETFLIYSRPKTQKLRNISINSRVALHLDGDGRGGNIVVITGEARIARDTPAADRVPAYAQKYEAGGYLARIGTSAAGFAKSYSVPIRVTPIALRGH